MHGRKRHLVDDYQTKRITGHINALEEATSCKQARRGVGAKRIKQGFLGHVVLHIHLDALAELAVERRSGVSQHAPTGEQHQCRATRHGNEFADACLQSGRTIWCIGNRQIVGQVEQRLLGIVERARHAHDCIVFDD